MSACMICHGPTPCPEHGEPGPSLDEARYFLASAGFGDAVPEVGRVVAWGQMLGAFIAGAFVTALAFVLTGGWS